MFEFQTKLNKKKVATKQDLDKVSPYDLKVDKTKKFGKDKPNEGYWLKQGG